MARNKKNQTSRRTVLRALGSSAVVSAFGSTTVSAESMNVDSRKNAIITLVAPKFSVLDDIGQGRSIRGMHTDNLSGVSVDTEQNIIVVSQEEPTQSLSEKSGNTLAISPNEIKKFNGEILESGSFNNLPIELDSRGQGSLMVPVDSQVNFPSVVGKNANESEVVIKQQGEEVVISQGEELQIPFYQGSHELPVLSNDPSTGEATVANERVNVGGEIAIQHLGETEIIFQ